MSSSKYLRLSSAALALSFALFLTACGGGGSSGVTTTGPGNGGGGNGSGGNNGPTSFYEPLVSLTTGGVAKGLWLVSSTQPGAAPLEVTGGTIDFPSVGGGTSLTFYDWSYDASSHTRNDLKPRFLAYGHAGHLFGVSLAQAGKPAQLSKGSYTGLCKLGAIQAGPFSSAPSFILATVTLSSSGTTCDTTWVISTGADAKTAPAVQLQPFTFFGGLKDTSTGLVTHFLVQAGSELDLYSTSRMTKTKKLLALASGTLVAALDPGSAPMAATQPLVLETQVGATVQDEVVLVDADKLTPMGTYGFPAGSTTCSDPDPRVTGTADGSELFYVVPSPTVGTRSYQLLSVPSSGGTPRQVFADGASCGGPIQLSKTRLLVAFNDGTDAGFISLDPTGTPAQHRVPLISGAVGSGFSFPHIEAVTADTAWVVTLTVDTHAGKVTDSTVEGMDVTTGHVFKTNDHSELLGEIAAGFDAGGLTSDSAVVIGTGKITTSCIASLDNMELVDPTGMDATPFTASGAPCGDSLLFSGAAPLVLSEIDSGSDGSAAVYISAVPGSPVQFGKVLLNPPKGGFFMVPRSQLIY
jgi:hypothetical protein